RIVAGDHDRLDAHAAQLGEALADAALDDVLQFDHAERLAVLGDDERRRALPGDRLGRAAHVGRQAATQVTEQFFDGVDRALADAAVVDVDAAHPRVRRERHEAYAITG